MIKGALATLVATAAACNGNSALPPGVTCWGNGFSGELGTDHGSAPHHVAGFDGATELYLTDAATCARLPGGMSCIGDLHDAQLGDTPRPLAGVPDASAIGGASLTTCALRASGAVACWGNNLVGELGNGAAPDPHTRVPIAVHGTDISVPGIRGARSDTPVAVTGLTDATALAVGASHACVLRKTGTVACWGGDDVGQLGDGGKESIDHPVEVPALSGVAEIAAGRHSTCARVGGSVTCWGNLVTQQTGPIAAVLWARPTAIAGVTNAAQLALDEGEACARLATGAVQCWGRDGKVFDRRVVGAVQLVAGFRHICARLQTGGVTCWGDNLNGQLGPDNSSDPVPGIDRAIALAAGGSHTCVIQAAR